jgi:hypothetical protein
MDAVAEQASSLDVTKPAATYDDVMDALTSIDQRLGTLEQFVADVRLALDNMPSLPFLPKFPKGTPK